MAKDILNKTGKVVYTNYDKDGRYVLLEIDENNNIKCLKSNIPVGDGTEALGFSIFESFTFEYVCNILDIEYSLNNWMGSHEIDCSKTLFDLVEAIEIVSTSSDSDIEVSQNLEVKTTHTDKDTYITEVPPLNISEETMQKQAEYTANEMFKVAEKLKTAKNIVDTTGNKDLTLEKKTYSLVDFNSDVQGVDAVLLDTLLHIKGAILLISPPGTGKTTTAIALANYIVGETNSERIKVLSFNQSTSYSDIIGGYRRNENGDWVITKGALFELCDKALEDPEHEYILITDEINRTNTEAAFGEALTGLSQRGKAILTNFGGLLIIPENLKLIATMNSTDSSITSLDTALVDRFAIYRMAETELNVYRINNEADEVLIKAIEKVRLAITEINKILKNDTFKKDDNKIGNRALYGNYSSVEELALVVKYDIQPKVEAKKSNLEDLDCRALDKLFKDIYEYLDEVK